MPEEVEEVFGFGDDVSVSSDEPELVEA